MALKICIVPASTQAGRETIRALLNDSSKPKVRAIYRNVSKAPQDFLDNPNFEAVAGDVSGATNLDFADSDAVLYVPPPTYDGTDTAEFAVRAANAVKKALVIAPKLQRLVVFSAQGSHHNAGIGILKINHLTDQVLQHAAPEVVIPKAGWFMENWASAFETLKSDRPYFESVFSPVDLRMAMVSVEDVGKKCAETLLKTGQALSSKPHVFDIHGPRTYTPADVKDALERATGQRVNIRLIERDALGPYFDKSVPAPQAQELAEMIGAMLQGGLLAVEADRVNGVERGSIELVDALQRLATGEKTKEISGAF